MPVAPQFIFPTMIGTGQLNDYEKYRPFFYKALEEDKKNNSVVKNSISKDLIHTVCTDDKSEQILNCSIGIKKYLAEFVEDLTQEVNTYAYQHFGINEDRCKFNMNVAWLNETTEGGFQIKHNHCNSFLSVVYYIDLPEEAPKTAFYRPLIDMKPYMSFEADTYHDANFEFIIPKMEEDTFIIFPSYLHHEVPAMPKCDKPRLTFSCNFLPDRIDTYSYIMELR
jgi:uncharacterized protein (TIGR02466 family)